MKPQQVISMVIIGASIILDIYWMIKHKKEWLTAIPEMTLLIHGLIFYVFVKYGLLAGNYSWWSSSLRLHSYIVVLLLIIYRLAREGVQCKRNRK